MSVCKLSSSIYWFCDMLLQRLRVLLCWRCCSASLHTACAMLPLCHFEARACTYYARKICCNINGAGVVNISSSRSSYACSDRRKSCDGMHTISNPRFSSSHLVCPLHPPSIQPSIHTGPCVCSFGVHAEKLISAQLLKYTYARTKPTHTKMPPLQWLCVLIRPYAFYDVIKA